MAVPVIASSSSDTTDGTANSTVSLAQPSGLVANDLIVILYAVETTNTNDTPTLSGYTKHSHADNGQDIQGAVYYKIASGSESWPLSVQATGASDFAVGWALRITGINTSSPINQSGTWEVPSGTVSTIDAPSVTTDTDDCLIIALAAYDGSDVAPASTSGTGWGTSPDASLEDPADNAAGCAADYISRSLTTAGASNAVTFTMGGTDGAIAVQIAIAPSAGGAKTGTSAMSIPVPTMSASGKLTYLATSAMTVPLPTMSASGKLTYLATSAMTIPLPTMTASGTVGLVEGTSVMTIPLPTMSASGKLTYLGTSAMTVPIPTMSASGKLTYLGTSAMTVPLPTMSASGNLTYLGTSAMTIPLPTMSAAGLVPVTGTSAMTIPIPTMEASGTAPLIVLSPSIVPVAGLRGETLDLTRPIWPWYYEQGSGGRRRRGR